MAILAILIRHAKPDLEGKVTESGRKMQKKVNDFLKSLEVAPTEIWTSPITRAKETAALVGEVFNVQPKEDFALSELELFDEMEITAKLAEMPDESTVIMVSHGPQIMRLASYWLGAHILPGAPPTSSATIIEFPGKVQEGGGVFVRQITYSDL